MSGPLQAQTSPPAAASPSESELDQKRHDMEALQSAATVSVEQKRKIEAEIEEIRTDRVRLNAALIDTTAKVHAAEQRADEIGERLTTMSGSEDAIRRSLESRRGVIAEVLASLQRLGRKPPPAILVRPEDILRTIRTSIMLGAVVPELRAEAEALASDLSDLANLKTSMAAERATLATQMADLNAETTRLQGLVDARQKALAEAQTTLDAEQRHAAEIAQQTTSLKDLISRMEGSDALARKAAEAAHESEVAQQKAAEVDADSIKAKVEAGPFRDPARLAPAVPFADTKGLLSLPLSGRIVKVFGQDDGYGGTEKGVSLQARQRSIVSAPADGWVAFSGPYRTYGQVLILNVGGGYYTVLAGMDHVDVAIGQFVLAGEPVGAMGDGSVKTAAAIALGATEPILYVEFRKDGAAVDPSPWWAKAALQKVRG
ncbi:murein hydrolase activator EnvC family protein [Lichenifustis flavocetrariae]|uniref:Peptidoglycan DD-metalloendopeptidase family protein n=1 Tax=Lichenifustis flavocetrariae TaxID=2949735 RepID=A0AA41YZI4_9HYPH|nr:peptidoglycan DD-metalloendopeptidase family protein [Lichenifustis flavocetrariae]MCW6510102.1 peptidoglycan DD-metalloendopeptidase family protein [Lichenifustis flavocetrariae]